MEAQVTASITLTLPCLCPEPGCKTWLQRRVDPTEGVEPHYRTCHPGKPVPRVTARGAKVRQP